MGENKARHKHIGDDIVYNPTDFRLAFFMTMKYRLGDHPVTVMLVGCFRYRCVNRNAKMVCSECPVGVVRYRAVPAGRRAHLQRSELRSTDAGRNARRRGYVRFGPDDTRRRSYVPKAQVPQDQQTIATGIFTSFFRKSYYNGTLEFAMCCARIALKTSE